MNLMVRNGTLSVPDGNLRALAPGGQIRFHAKGSAAKLPAAVPGVGTAFEALEDFRYKVLTARVAYAEIGTLLLKLHLKGNSPKLQGNRPIEINLNLEQNILSLLRSLRLVNGLNERLDSRVRAYYEEQQRSSARSSPSP